MQFECTKIEDFDKFINFSKNLQNPKLIISGEFNESPNAIEEFILSDIWPKAIPDSLIVRSKESIIHRAKSIIGSFVGNLNGQKFLDFGCGNGRCVEAADNSKLSVGYDIKPDEDWKELNVNLTTNWGDVEKHGIFDKILLYDVFDHIKEDELPNVLQKLSKISGPQTTIIVRCHPWTSIHGGHLYENLNKAYAHLFMTDEQLLKYQTSEVRKITRPMKTYKDAWNSGGFIVEKTDIHKTNWENHGVGKFFQESSIVEFLDKNSPQKVSGTAQWQKDVLPIEFVDFTLKKS